MYIAAAGSDTHVVNLSQNHSELHDFVTGWLTVVGVVCGLVMGCLMVVVVRCGGGE